MGGVGGGARAASASRQTLRNEKKLYCVVVAASHRQGMTRPWGGRPRPPQLLPTHPPASTLLHPVTHALKQTSAGGREAEGGEARRHFLPQARITGNTSWSGGSARRLRHLKVCSGEPPAYLASSLDNHSRPSYRPVPWVAHVAWMYHWGGRERERDRLSDTHVHAHTH